MRRHIKILFIGLFIGLALVLAACASTVGGKGGVNEDSGAEDGGFNPKKDQMPPDQLYSAGWAGPSQTATGWRLNFGR